MRNAQMSNTINIFKVYTIVCSTKEATYVINLDARNVLFQP